MSAVRPSDVAIPEVVRRATTIQHAGKGKAHSLGRGAREGLEKGSNVVVLSPMQPFSMGDSDGPEDLGRAPACVCAGLLHWLIANDHGHQFAHHGIPDEFDCDEEIWCDRHGRGRWQRR